MALERVPGMHGRGLQGFAALSPGRAMAYLWRRAQAAAGLLAELGAAVPNLLLDAEPDRAVVAE